MSIQSPELREMPNLGMVLGAVEAELERGFAKYPQPFNSGHEGYAVILEELDELWDEVKADRSASFAAATEAIQVAATAIRYVVDLYGAGARAPG